MERNMTSEKNGTCNVSNVSAFAFNNAIFLRHVRTRKMMMNNERRAELLQGSTAIFTNSNTLDLLSSGRKSSVNEYDKNLK